MRFAFQGFVFDSDARELLRCGEIVHLTPKAFQLLGLLLEARPSVLTRRVLLEKLWPETSVGDGSLPTLVSEIRHALGGEAPDGQIIRTVHRVGYAFVGTVSIARGELSPFILVPVGRPGSEFKLREGENLIGREPGGLNMDSATVSRRHAVVIVHGDEVTVRDLESKNGTFVRGERVTSDGALRDGDELRVGSERCVLRRAGVSETITVEI